MSDNGEGPMDAYVAGGKVLVVASSGVGRLMLVNSTGSKTKGGRNSLRDSLPPHTRPLWT